MELHLVGISHSPFVGKEEDHNFQANVVLGTGFLIVSNGRNEKDTTVRFEKNGQPAAEFVCTRTGTPLNKEETLEVLNIIKSTIGRQINGLPCGTIERLESSLKEPQPNAKDWAWSIK